MELTMQYTYQVYLEKSFTKAADKLYVSQPALSAMVKKEEAKICCDIFNRSTTPISLTKEGRKYIEFVEKIMDIYREMDIYFETKDSKLNDLIRFGGTGFFCSYFYPPVIEEFKKEYPSTGFTMEEATNYELSERLINNDLDIFLEVDDMTISNVEQFSWGKEALLLAVPVDNPINKKIKNMAVSKDDIEAGLHMTKDYPAINVSLFKDQPYILMRSGNDTYLRAMNICENQGFKPEIFLMVDSLLTAALLAAENYGVAFIRDEVVKTIDLSKKLYYYKIDDPLAIRDLYVYHREDISQGSIVRVFLDFLKQNPFRSY